MLIMNYYVKALQNYANFSGRARRSEYWYFALFNLFAIISTAILDRLFGTTFDMGFGPSPYGYITILYYFFIFIPSLAVLVRRLHDVGKSGWFILISIIPFVGAIWLMVLLLKDSDIADNAYGSNPKLDSKEISPTTNHVPQGSAATTTNKSSPIGLIVGIALILGVGYLIWNGNTGTQNEEVQIIKEEKESIGSSIKIGAQVWQAENLNVERFRNGDLIPHAITDEEWKEAAVSGEPAWCYYDNDPENGKIYGKLYNWYAVNDSRGIAPEGWHIPTDEEWTTLTDYLGGEEVAGGKMKTTATVYWEAPNEGATNESGFSTLPGGFRDNDGSFGSIRIYAFFWSASEGGDFGAWCRSLACFHNGGFKGSDFKQRGFSVRCLRD
jgi:uncharacterized protein (TIGR02145 family)